MEQALTWKVSYVTVPVARAVLADPTLVVQGAYTRNFDWHLPFHTNRTRLDQKLDNAYLRPPDYCYGIKYVLEGADDYVRVYRPLNPVLSNKWWVAHGQPDESVQVAPVRVVMVHKPSYEQGKLTFNVDGMNGDTIGTYQFPLGSRVTCATLYPMVRRDLDIASTIKVV